MAELRALGDGGLGEASLLAGGVGIQVHKGIQLGMQGFDAMKMGFHELDGRNFPGANGISDLLDGGVSWAHGMNRKGMCDWKAGQACKISATMARVITVDDGRLQP